MDAMPLYHRLAIVTANASKAQRMTWPCPLRHRRGARMAVSSKTISGAKNPMSHIIRFGIDLAKHTFAICGVDEHDHMTVKKTLSRKQLLTFFANTPPTMIAMEAGSGAHHWARELIALGHDARIYSA